MNAVDIDQRAQETAQLFQKWIEGRGHQVTPDGRVSEDQAADLLGRSSKTLRNMRAVGLGPPFFKAGGRIEYRISDLAQWIERNREETLL